MYCEVINYGARTTTQSDRAGKIISITDDVQKFSLKMKFEEMSSNGRTSTLWANYHKIVSIIRSYIRAERLHKWDLHLAAVEEMLEVFAAAGHGQYAKAGRLYLEMMSINAFQNKSLFEMFNVDGLHTVRYSTYEWSGVWTDMPIEQNFMKACKSSGGLTSGRLRNAQSAEPL